MLSYHSLYCLPHRWRRLNLQPCVRSPGWRRAGLQEYVAYPRAARVRVPLTHRPSVSPPDKYPPEVLRPLLCQARLDRGDALFTGVRGIEILGSSSLEKMLILSLSPYVFISGQWVGLTY